MTFNGFLNQFVAMSLNGFFERCSMVFGKGLD